MKRFIKTADGWYIDRDKIDSFTVAKYYAGKGKGEGYAVCAYNDEQRWRLKEFVIETDEMEAKAQAEAWLDKFVSELNGEDRTDRAKLIEVAARVRSIAEDVRMSENSNDNYGYYCQLCDAADDIEIIADED